MDVGGGCGCGGWDADAAVRMIEGRMWRCGMGCGMWMWMCGLGCGCVSQNDV